MGEVEVGKKVKCKRCGYEWHYKGQGVYAKCPNCRASIRVKPHIRKVYGRKVVCDRCGYEWYYSGRRNIAVCYRCGHVIRLDKISSEVNEEKGKKSSEKKGKYKEVKDGEGKTKKGIKIKCKCGYEWEYKGKNRMARCPNCNAKIRIIKVKLVCPVCKSNVEGRTAGESVKCENCGAIINVKNKLVCPKCKETCYPVWNGSKWTILHEC